MDASMQTSWDCRVGEDYLDEVLAAYDELHCAFGHAVLEL